MSRRLRVALVSTPFIAVPPREYGGTELIVAELALGLRALGLTPVVYATGDSRLDGIECRATFAEAVWPPQEAPERLHAAWAMRDIAHDGGFDLIHTHSAACVALRGQSALPMVHTIHHDRDPALSAIYAREPAVHRVAISESQARREPAGAHSVVHHGLPPERFLDAPDGGYLLFIGRYCAQKAPHLAIDAAQRAGLPIVLAGRVHREREDDDYYESELRRRLALPGVTDVGPVGGARKLELLAGARALIFPIQWEEPFGLVMIEAMLSGVPVLALAHGSVPEVVEQGVSGRVCSSLDELAEAARYAHRFDRAVVRARAVSRFSAARMAESYLQIYQRVLEEREEPGSRLGS